MSDHVFDLCGGHLALDFANTVSGMRGAIATERLGSYADLVAFARQAGALDERQAARLREEARRSPDAAAVALAEAIALREALYRAFLERTEGKRPRSADLAVVNAALARALAHRRLVGEDAPDGAVALAWEDAPALDAPLWPIADAAATLLVDRAAHVRVCGLCETHECGWLFVDRTKARTRRWCSMKDCGNRAKARRHHRKVKAGA